MNVELNAFEHTRALLLPRTNLDFICFFLSLYILFNCEGDSLTLLTFPHLFRGGNIPGGDADMCPPSRWGQCGFCWASNECRRAEFSYVQTSLLSRLDLLRGVAALVGDFKRDYIPV